MRGRVICSSGIALATASIICAGSVQAGTEDEVKAQFSRFVALRMPMT
jgi:hypothetical protein